MKKIIAIVVVLVFIPTSFVYGKTGTSKANCNYTRAEGHNQSNWKNLLAFVSGDSSVKKQKKRKQQDTTSKN